MSEVLITCENVGKKFCRDLKKSLWYGVKDSAADLFGKRKQPSAPANCQLPTADSPELRRGEFWANKDINFELKRGECLGLIGHNGAGKTTLLKMLNGLIKPDVGAIRITGQVSALIALGAGFNPILTGRENIFVNSLILGQSQKQTIAALDDIIEFSELEIAIDSPVRTYSSGMQVRLGFAIAAQMNPEIMLVDEVLAVGDNAFQKKCFDRIHELRRNGTSFIVVSHNPYQLERLCDVVAAMSDGCILKLADPKEAILLYHTELRRLRPLRPLREQTAIGDREGTGQARIVRVVVEDDQDQITDEIETGDPFTICADCDFKESMTDVRIRFAIYSESNVLLANTGSNGTSENWCFDQGMQRVTFRFDSCSLLTGVYSIEAVVVNVRGDPIDRIGQAVSFSVHTRMKHIVEQTAICGLVHLPGNWSHEINAIPEVNRTT